jgi:Do/DeqQ family serine protease
MRRVLAVAGAAGLLAAGLVAGSVAGGSAQAGSLEAVRTTAGVAPVPASSGYAEVVSRVAPSIVTVRSERLVKPAAMPFGHDGGEVPFFGRGFGLPGPEMAPRRQGGLGSGVIVSSEGYLLTNNHVVAGAEKVRVELQDKRSFVAKVVGTDAASDLAVLKVEASGLPALAFGDSEALRVGDVVLAFGNPLGVGQTVTMGIVSAKGRATGTGDGSFEDFLQTDAPINQGNSGGALVNTAGQLVGINSQIVTPSGGNIGIGFAIPSRMAENVMGQLVKTGRVQRSQLGVAIQGVSPEIAASLGLKDERGALVSSVSKDSPAEKAGLAKGDVIVSIDGVAVSDGNALRNRIASTKPGSTVSLGIVRDGAEKTVEVRLRELAPTQAAEVAAEPAEGARLGLSVRPVTPEDARELGLESGKGLLVAEVDPAGPAAAAGIQPGDVIEEVNRQPVTDAAGLRAAAKSSGERPALVLVNRKGASLFLAMELPKA